MTSIATLNRIRMIEEQIKVLDDQINRLFKLFEDITQKNVDTQESKRKKTS